MIIFICFCFEVVVFFPFMLLSAKLYLLGPLRQSPKTFLAWLKGPKIGLLLGHFR